MKILSLRLKNLNSLVEDTTIDFTKSPFDASGIFAIIGPTGSGKTTILDAICLALYGRTPRLKSISVTTNELMPRSADSCYCEAVFETNRNGRFRCRWEQARTGTRGGKKAAKPFRPVEHWIYEPDGDDWVPINQTPGQVPKIVEEKTGMDFERFTRSILLAQGDFAVFLESSHNDRAAILEQISGGDIYSRISKQVYERFKKEETELSLLTQLLEGIKFLEPEAETAIRAELASYEKRAEEVRTRLALVQAARRHLADVDRLRREAVHLETDRQRIEQAMLDFAPKAERLAAARKAMKTEAAYEKFATLRVQLDTAGNTVRELTERLPNFETKFTQTHRKETEASEELATYRNNQANEKPAIQAVRALDVQLRAIDQQRADARHRIRQSEKDVSKYEANLTRLENDLKKLFPDESFKDLEAKIELLRNEILSLQNGKSFNDLVAEQQRLNGRQTLLEKLDSMKADLSELDTEKANWDSQNLSSRERSVELTGTLEQKTNESAEAERVMEEIKNELFGRKRIQGYEEERKTLEDGAPCPLCGALHHPFAEGNVPPPDEIATKLEAVETELRNRKSEADAIRVEIAKLKNLIEQAGRELQKIAEKRAKIDGTATDYLDRLGLETVPENIPAAIEEVQTNILAVSQCLEEAGKRRSEVERLEEKLGEGRTIDNEITKEQALLEQSRQELETRRQELAKLDAQRQEKDDERVAVFGERDPDNVEKMLAEDVVKAEHRLEAARNLRMESETLLAGTRERLKTAKETLENSTVETAAAKALYEERLAESGFETEAAFLEARLETNAFEELEKEESELRQRREENESHRRRNDKELARILASVDPVAEPVYAQSPEDLERESGELERQRQENDENTGRLREKLAVNEDAKKDYAEKLEQKRAREERFHIWSIMKNLIGSSEGDKFRVFVQGLTFRAVIRAANRQLRKMNDRYVLDQKDPVAAPLDLVLIDTCQADAVRTSENLSGGERFQVSLALALGLASMASNRVRVDSLFLDEGFGTLDPETLATALDTLEGLREEGKQIGIISHVEAVQERFPVQIQVERIREGQSRVTVVG